MAEVTLDFLAQQAKILAELSDARAERADMRADMTVLLAIVQRLDASVMGLTITAAGAAGKRPVISG